MSHRANRQRAHSAKTERATGSIAGFLLQSEMIADLAACGPREVALGALCCAGWLLVLPLAMWAVA